MAKDNSSSKTVLIVVAIILGILLVGGIIFGVSCYYSKSDLLLYKEGSQASKTSTPASPTAGWKNYQNARYSLTIKYPSTFAAQESQNGDGITLTSSSPAITIRAYGSPNSLNQNLDEYLNTARANLFNEVGSAEELAAEDTTLGGAPAQERIWRYINSVDGTLTVMDQVTTLKISNFYTVQMVITDSDYSQYSPMFDQVLASYAFK